MINIIPLQKIIRNVSSSINFTGTVNVTGSSIVSANNIGVFAHETGIHFHFAGDSLSNDEADGSGWQQQLVTGYSWLASRVIPSNSAVMGRPIAGVVGDYETSDLPNKKDNQSWYFLWVGANNIAGSNPDTGAFLSSWVSFLQRVRADGWTKIVAFTLLRRSDGTNGAPTEAARQIINNTIRRRSDLWDILIEPDVLFPDETNTIWFDNNIHLTPEANRRLAKHVAWVIASNGSFNPTNGAIVSGPLLDSMMQTMSARTIKGNKLESSATPTNLSPDDINVMLPIMTGDSGGGGVKGLVPPPAAGDAAARRYLGADGLWSVPPAANGMSNPMSAVGDIIYGGISGEASRLPIGSDDKILAVVSGVPKWVTNVAGFANPMSNTGDLILGSAGGTAARLPVGDKMATLSVNNSGHVAWLSARNVAIVEDDFLTGPRNFSTNNNGSGSSSAPDSTANGFGVMKLSTGTTSTGRGVLFGGTTSYTLFNITNTQIFFRAIVYVPTLSDAVDSFVLFAGLNNQYGANVPTGNQIQFSYTHDEDEGKWRLTCRSGSSESTINGVTVVAGQYYTLEFLYDGNSTVTAWVNGTLIGTVTTNIPTSGLGPIVSMIKTAGTTNRDAFVDYIGTQLTVSR